MFKKRFSPLPHLILFIFLVSIGCSPETKEPQKKSDTIKKQETSIDTLIPPDDHFCVYQKTDKTLNTTFPFNEATKIQVVSYYMRKHAYGWDTLISKGKFIVKGIKEKITLSNTQTDSLFSILYNYQLKPNTGIPMADCYTPRHSIIFYKNAEAIAFYEICFDCGGTRRSKEVDFGTMCPEKQEHLRKFFKSIGIKYEIDQPQYE